MAPLRTPTRIWIGLVGLICWCVLGGAVAAHADPAVGPPVPAKAAPAVREPGRGAGRGVEEFGDIRGLVRPRTEAVLSSQIDARIQKLPREDGARFKKGDTLVQFDCAMHRARLGATRAQLEAKDKTHRNNLQLAKLNAIGKLEVEVSAAQVREARAEVKIAEVVVSRCKIAAPYHGRVVGTKVNAFESVSAGQELMRILDDTQLEIELIVPSKWLTWLESGTEFQFRIDETGREYPVRVSQIGAVADPISQTVRLEAFFQGDPKDVLSGMSGTAHFPIPAATRE